MKPIEFFGQNIVMAKDQPQYKPLPAYRDFDEGTITSCWGLTWIERLTVLFTGKFYIKVLTFNQPLQPILPSVENPLEN